MENACPECCARESYQLADGRRQCKVCRRKFTPGGRKRKLAVQTQNHVRNAFWEMQPAEEVANIYKINRKTVQKMYGEFRQMIAEFNRQQRTQQLAETTGGAGCSQSSDVFMTSREFPMFYLVDHVEFIGMYMADDFSRYAAQWQLLKLPVLMVYRLQEGGVLLEPDAVYRRMLWNAEKGHNCLSCLEFMLRHMKTYRGIPGDKSALYAEEMLFRYNCRDRGFALDYLDPAGTRDGEKTMN